MIERAGIYDIPSDAYHGAGCCDGPSLSSSGLRTLLLQSPAHYWVESALNPRRVERTTATLDFGRAAHALVLGEPEFARHFVASPYDDFRTKEARAWRDGETRTVVTSAQLDVIQAMARAIRQNPATAGCFRAGTGKPEQSIFWRDGDLWLKARPDWLPDDPAQMFVTEYKTARSADPRHASSQAFALGYDIQAAMIVDGIAAVTGKAPLGVAHVVQEKEPPYACTLLLFGPEQIEIGRARYRRALTIFRCCFAAMKAGAPEAVAWPGYATEPRYFTTPAWVTRSLQEDDDHDVDGHAPRYGAEDYAAAL